MWKGIEIELFIVYDDRLMPCPDASACAIYGFIEGEKVNKIYILERYTGYKDIWGYSVLYHEIKHIECQCNWHEGLRWA